MNCLCYKAWASNYLTTESHIAYREEKKKRNILLYSSHTLPCFDYCLSLAKTYSAGGTLIVTLHHTGLACSNCYQICNQHTSKHSVAWWKQLQILSDSPYCPWCPFIPSLIWLRLLIQGMTSLVLCGISLSHTVLGLAAPSVMQLSCFCFITAGCSLLIVAPHVILVALSPHLLMQHSRAMISAVNYFW